VGLAGCAGFTAAPRTPDYDSDLTRALLTALENTNARLSTGKWRGKVAMTVDGQRRTLNRAIWAGAEPGRVRFDARNPFGLPVFSVACDENYLTAVAHDERRYFRRKTGAESLGQVFPVDITCRDLYRLLVGRPPVVDFHDAMLEEEPGTGRTIRLKRRFRGTVAKLSIDYDSGDLVGVETFDIHGNRRYRARLTQRRTVGGFRLPHEVFLEGGDGQLLLEIARFEPNQPVPAALFSIAPPD
jgi:hypothetical protein